MDVTRIVALVVSLGIFLVALYEAISIVSIVGKIPRFWIFFIAAIALLIGNRVVQIFAPSVGASEFDSDVIPIVFSSLLLLWVYDMRRSFERAAPRSKTRQELVAAPEQS